MNEISSRHGGIPAGEANGERGYMLTFVIAYIRVSNELRSVEYYILTYRAYFLWDEISSFYFRILGLTIE